MTFCVTPASISPRRIFWGRQEKPENRPGSLNLAAVLAHQIGGGAASRHFVPQLLEAQPRVTFAIVHELDRGILRHRPGHERGRVLADRLVDIIRAVILAHRPFETDRSHRPWTEFGVAGGFDRWRRPGLIFNGELFPPPVRFGLALLLGNVILVHSSQLSTL